MIYVVDAHELLDMLFKVHMSLDNEEMPVEKGLETLRKIINNYTSPVEVPHILLGMYTGEYNANSLFMHAYTGLYAKIMESVLLHNLPLPITSIIVHDRTLLLKFEETYSSYT